MKLGCPVIQSRGDEGFKGQGLVLRLHLLGKTLGEADRPRRALVTGMHTWVSSL